MAVNEIIVKGLVEIEVSGKSGAEAVAAMKKLVAEAEKVEKATKGVAEESKKAAGGADLLQASVLRLGAAFAGAFAIGAVSNFLRDSFIGFARMERVARVTENQIRALGDAGAASVETFRPFIRSLSFASGILSEELIPAFQHAITVYKDYDAAQQAIGIAAKFAAAGIGTVGSNVEALTRFFQTGSTAGLAPFISNLKSAEGGTASWSEILPQLVSALEALGKPLDDAQKKLDNVAVAMEVAQDITGALANQILDLSFSAIPSLLFALSGIAGPIGIAANAALTKLEKAERDAAVAALDLKVNLDALDDVNTDAQDDRDKVKRDRLAKAALKAEENRLKRVAELEQSAGEQLLQQQIANTIAGTDERIKLELALNDRVYQAAKRNAEAIKADTLEITKLFVGERDKILNQTAAAEDAGLLGPGNIAGLKDFLSAMEAQEQAYDQHQERLTRLLEDGLLARLELTAELSPEGSQEKIDAQNTLEEERLKVQTAREIRAARGQAKEIDAIRARSALFAQIAEVIQHNLKTANARAELTDKLRNASAIAGILSQTFAKHKAFAIAMAIVNTALGIASVWSDPSLISFYAKIAATLVVAASGLAQISAIRSASIGGGGGAGGGGATTASAPTQSAAAPPTQVSNQSDATIESLSGRSSGRVATTIIQIGNAFGDDRSMTKLARQINRINANDQGALR